MPRKSRIDAPGAFHHIIARGIERSDIFKDNTDRPRQYTKAKIIDMIGFIKGQKA
jgi:hypothetical protein